MGIITKHQNTKRNPIQSILDTFSKELEGCQQCSLGQQDCNFFTGPVLYRGSCPHWLILGEALGKKEAEQRLPFIGPAGKLLDDLIQWMKLPDYLQDPIVTNTCLCRPVAIKGSGRENNKPTPEQISICKRNLLKTIDIVKPKIIVATGKVPVSALLPNLEKLSMGKLVGNIYNGPNNIPVMPVYHPAFLLRKRYTQDKDKYKKITKDYLLKLKGYLENDM